MPSHPMPPNAHTSPAPLRVLIAGASGLIGRELVRQCLSAGDEVHALVRRAPSTTAVPANPPSGGVPQRLFWHVADFAALSALPQAEIALCALGTTLKTVGSPEAFRAVDFDAVLAFARAAKAAGAKRLGVVSALGANAKSGNFYSRVKGEMEAAIVGLGFEALLFARPSLLAGDRAALGQPERLGERWALALTAPFSNLIPAAWRPIQAASVARALRLHLQDMGPGVQVLNSAQLQRRGS